MSITETFNQEDEIDMFYLHLDWNILEIFGNILKLLLCTKKLETVIKLKKKKFIGKQRNNFFELHSLLLYQSAVWSAVVRRAVQGNFRAVPAWISTLLWPGDSRTRAIAKFF